MSNREKCYDIINSFSDEQLTNIIEMLISTKTLAEESADNAYCLRLYNDYQADNDKGEPIDVVSFAQSLGIAL